MRTIDLSTWPRRQHFRRFHAFDYPHFNLCAPLDVTVFLPAVKAAGAPVNTAVMYVLARAANQQAAFRLRIRGQQVVEHAVVHPAPTVLGDNELFHFYSFAYSPHLAGFIQHERQARQAALADPALEDEPGRDDYLFMSCLPWVAFTGLSHPLQIDPDDSIPRLSWGKFSPQGTRISMPLSVQVNHALMDGLHVGRYFEQVQALCDDPAWLSDAGAEQ